MSLPSIKVSLPVLMVAWGVGAVVADKWPLLLYPAIWLAVGAVLYGVNLALGGAVDTEASTASAASDS